MTAETRAQSSGCLYPRPVLSAEHLTPSLDYALERVSPAPPPRLAPWGPGAGGLGWSSGISLARLSPPPHPLIGGQACAPVLLSQLKSQMVPGGGQGSKDLMPEPQPLWFVCVLEGEINIVENHTLTH